MKKMNYLAIAALMFGAVACGNNNTEATDECTSSDACKEAAATGKAVTGVVMDAAMNSIVIVTPNNDTLSFGYPELDRANIAAFELNDTVTVNLAAAEIDGVQKDTVTSIVKGVPAACCGECEKN